MKPETSILVMHILLGIVFLITFLRYIFFNISFAWMLFVFLIWVIVWRYMELDRKGKHHERLNLKKRRR